MRLALPAMFYLSAAVCVVGVIWRVFSWLRAPVPLKIPLTPGPGNISGAAARLAGEAVFFRTLFGADRMLWLGAWIFHVSLVFLAVGHFGGLVTPEFSRQMLGFSPEQFKHFAHVAGGVFGVMAFAPLLYLLLRRLALERLRYVSNWEDYFLLALLLLIVISGNQMRFMSRFEIERGREFVGGLLALRPVDAPSDPMFVFHFALVCALMICLPFGKLTHLGGMFLNPALNQANNPREKRHVNPWDNAPSGTAANDLSKQP